ncbi:Adenylosuccinate synthetase [uncultured archaeon]|nr:Adenylosuccinate synthetase [uncultured archaeon]
MSATVVVGGQYGDEGKGKILSYLALHDKPDVIARGGGGPNAGHSVEHEGKKYKIRLCPSGLVNKTAKLVIGAGVFVDPDVFIKEVEEFGLKGRCFIDRRCTLLEPKYKDEDAASEIGSKIGTTKTGIGPTAAARAKRIAKFVEEEERLKPYLCDSVEIIHSAKNALVEGSQGFMLSNLYGTYPYCTAKDVSASAICSEVGLGPLDVKSVIMVIKAYTTRVGHGPFPGEVSVAEAEKLGMQEYGTVTGRPRRTNPGLIWDELKTAARVNSADCIALTKLDVKYPACAGAKEYAKLPADAKKFVEEIEKKLGVKVGLIGTGPAAGDIIDRRAGQ